MTIRGRLLRRVASAQDVAAYFLANQDEDAAELMSNLKLQKLIYYAQGLHLGRFDEPLFSERIKAWKHGPVVPDVWHTYKAYSWGAIPRPANFDRTRYSEDVQDVLDEANRTYGGYTATQLRDMSHLEPPWREAWERVQNGDRDDEIRVDAMHDHFRALMRR